VPSNTTLETKGCNKANKLFVLTYCTAPTAHMPDGVAEEVTAIGSR